MDSPPGRNIAPPALNGTHPLPPGHQLPHPGENQQHTANPGAQFLRPPSLQQETQPQTQQQQHMPSIQADPIMQIRQHLQQQQSFVAPSAGSFATTAASISTRTGAAYSLNDSSVPATSITSGANTRLASNIIEFRYEPDNGVTFAAWYTRYDSLFTKDAERLDDEAKVRLLLRKLGPSEHERYVSYILPKTPREVTFESTVVKLKGLFGTAESLISRRYRCLQVIKQPGEDYKMNACRLKRLCVEFELAKMDEEQFKCLLFVCGLRSEVDSEIRTRLLTRIEENTSVTLEHISDECQRLLSIKHTAMIESSASVKALKRSNPFAKQEFKQEKGPGPATPCWNCGAMHYAKDCTYIKHRCNECGQYDHREGYCSSARKSSNSVKKEEAPFDDNQHSSSEQREEAAKICNSAVSWKSGPTTT
ncbi:uncharacterized protein LOC134207407 [Armigeres subalbatus]|uniref:uncharacterized protein LOC134207407 n=1 Tax=Armigeres subalbatus TaxID=124917 RepID=UPI002ED3A641